MIFLFFIVCGVIFLADWLDKDGITTPNTLTETDRAFMQRAKEHIGLVERTFNVKGTEAERRTLIDTMLVFAVQCCNDRRLVALMGRPAASQYGNGLIDYSFQFVKEAALAHIPVDDQRYTLDLCVKASGEDDLFHAAVGPAVVEALSLLEACMTISQLTIADAR